MEITYDEHADALYILFQSAEGKVKETIKFRDGILVDIGQDDQIFGLEILDATRRIPIEELGHLNINLPVHT